jgi:hypothetical protein
LFGVGEITTAKSGGVGGSEMGGLEYFRFIINYRKKYIIIDKNKKCKNFYIFSITLSLLKGEFSLLLCSM